MGKGFVCENTRAEFEAAYKEVFHRYGTDSGRLEENTIICDEKAESKSFQFDPFVFKRSSSASGYHENTCNSAISDEALTRFIPWQDIGDRLEHTDIYQRYTLDTRCVPEEYRQVVDTLVRLEYLDTESLIRQGISAVPASVSGAKGEHENKADYNKLKICVQDVKNKNDPNNNVNNFGFSQAPIKIRVNDDNTYNFDKFVKSKLQTKLSENVSQSNSNRPMRYAQEVHQSERRKENVLANQTKSRDEVVNKIDKQTASHIEQRKKTSKNTPSSRAWRFVKSGLVFAGSVTAAAFVFKRFF